MSEWREYKLADLYSFSSGLSKPREEFGFGYPFLTFKEIYSNRRVPNILTELVNSTEKERLRCSIKRGDVFLLRTSETVDELGMSCVALKNYENATFNGFTKRLRPKSEEVVFPEFAIYLFYSRQVRHQIVSFATITTRSSLNNSILEQISISVPSLSKQRRIATILSTLDTKIDLLRRQNHTLEQIAQTLFKRWFVEFEFPNEYGQPYKSSGGPMVASELGEIPEGWRVGTLGEILHLNYGKGLRVDDRKDGKYLVVGSSGVVGTHNEYLVQAPGIVIGRKGTIGKVIWLNDNFFPIDTTFYVTDILGLNELYFHYFILLRQRFDRIGSDSAVPGLNRNLALGLEEIIPELGLIKKFSVIIKPIFNKIYLNSVQIQTLTRLRDTLLPKLMSGKLRVKGSE